MDYIHVSGEGSVAGCSEKMRGIFWLLERLIGCQKRLRSTHLVIDMPYQTSVCLSSGTLRDVGW